MDTPTFSPAGVGSPTSPSVLRDLSTMTDMVTELTRPVDTSQLNREIEEFDLTYPVNVDDALNAFTLPPVAGTGTATTTVHHHHHSHPNPSHHNQPTTTRHLHPNTPRHHRHDHHCSPTPLHRSPQRWGRDPDHHLHSDNPDWTSHRGCQTTTTTTSPRTLPTVPPIPPLRPMTRMKMMTMTIDGGD